VIPLLSSLTAASSVLLLSVWYGMSRHRHDERLRTLLEPQRMIAEQQDPFTQRVAFPVVDGLVRLLLAILPTALIGRSRSWLITAGDRMSLTQFLSIVVMSTAGFAAVTFLVIILLFQEASGLPLLLTLPLLTFVGFLLPFAMVRRAARRRQREIWRALPSSLDLLTTCVEAGLSLDFALQRVSDRYRGPLSDEITRALREMGLGKPRREALHDMTVRIDLPDISTFINSLLQAEALGTSVGQVLRVQAAQMRLKRRQHAEEIARRAPVKMVFPLVLFLMPSLFIVTLGPVILSVIRAFSEN
jgi:tight adherence protein C